MTLKTTTTPGPGPYTGDGVNLAHALHEALRDAEARDPNFRVGKHYEHVTTMIEAGNSHVNVFRVVIDG